ncbi:protein DML1 [Rhizodiscina lignyota]|uniref:Protein DML1 n=1 Tax=Rhizodiscina lignyota TaxID=1504668 RepID=A0A9P4IQI7_9PEZI|nr:protein DML1 [Rhizodiscina lignyota]
MHEIVTLQFGEQGNYLGTHFWNTQESYFTYSAEDESPVDHDIHFRPGVGSDGSDTFMPRALVYDLKSNFGSLRKLNALYEASDQGNNSNLWNNSPTIHRQPPIQPHPYQVHLEQGTAPPPLSSSTVRYWSDFNRVYYHPRSLVPVSLNDIPSSSQLSSFGDWQTGEELFAVLDREHDLLDRDVRHFAEECDQLQAFQIFADVGDAWGGWTASWLERLRDEYGKTGIWTWGLEGPIGDTRERRLKHALDASRSLSAIVPNASIYVPVSSETQHPPSYLHVDKSMWQIGALQAAAVESCTLPARLRPVDGRMVLLGDLELALNRDGVRKVSELEYGAASASALSGASAANGDGDHRMMNGAVNDDQDAPSKIDRFEIRLFSADQQQARTHLNGHGGTEDHIFGRAESLRGTWKPTIEIEEGNIASRDRFASGGGTTIIRHQSSLLFPLLSSFPRIFDVDTAGMDTLAMRAALSTSSAVSKRLQNLEQIVLRSPGVNVDDRNGIGEALRGMAEEYTEGWESGIDSEDDDL